MDTGKFVDGSFPGDGALTWRITPEYESGNSSRFSPNFTIGASTVLASRHADSAFFHGATTRALVLASPSRKVLETTFARYLVLAASARQTQS